MIRRLFPYRGIRIRPFYLHIRAIIFGLMLLPFVGGLGYYLWFIRDDVLLKPVYWASLSVALFIIMGILVFVFEKQLFLSSLFFSRLDNLEVMARFLLEGNYVHSKKSQGREIVRLPKVYLKRNRYGLDVTFILRGNKFQDRFLRLGGQLETMFDGDFMAKQFTRGFVTYSIAIDQFSGRINVSDVAITNKGLKLMEDVYWDFNEQPHLLVSGGTGGGKTVTLMSIILGLVKVGHVWICDPKKSDFVGLKDVPVFHGHVYWSKDDMAACLKNAVEFMNERYVVMTEHPDYQAGKRYSAYGMKPLFVVFDEWAAFMAELDRDYKLLGQVTEYVTQIVLKGRQAGVFMILAMQRPDGEYIKTALRDNFMKRLSVGHLEDTGYMMMFGDANRTKEFKKIDEIDGKKVYGRGYIANGGEIAREFYSPYVPFDKGFSFLDALVAVEPLEPLVVALSSEEILSLSNEEVIDLPSPDEIMVNAVEEQVKTMADLSVELDKTPKQIRHLIGLIEKGRYRRFVMKDGKYCFAVEDCIVLERLFEQKDSFEGTWEELLKHYFVGN